MTDSRDSAALDSADAASGEPARGPSVASDVLPSRGDAFVATPPHTGRRAAIRRALSFRNVSAIYILIGLLVLFSLWVPNTFFSAGVWKSLLDEQALTALVAIGLVMPLAAGAFDLAVGTEVGFGGILVAWLIVHRGIAPAPAIAVALAAGAAIGATSGVLIVRARIDSFIATLGMSSILVALTEWVSGSEQILNLGGGFQGLATNTLLGLTYPVWFMLVAAVIVWYVLERTPAGRQVYATGGNIGAARLAGVRTSAVIVLSLVGCGVLAAAAGVLQSAQLATGDPTVGPAFLLPAYAAAFLGSTQFKGGRYNVWGTVLAVYVLAIGVKGLQLAGAPVWIPDLFNGLALLLAVGLAKYQATTSRAAAIRRLLRLDRSGPSAAVKAAPIEEAVRPFLARLHLGVSETVVLAVLDGERVRVVDQLIASSSVPVVQAKVKKYPLHCTAMGKALLASLPDEVADALTSGRLKAFTPRTTTDSGRLRAELGRARRDGVAYEYEEHTRGVGAVGAVVRDSSGALAAMSILVPAHRFSGRADEIARVLLQTCADCSHVLTGSEAPGPIQERSGVMEVQQVQQMASGMERTCT